MIYKKLSDFDYHLPAELIAQEPVSPRDHSRLLLLDKKSGEMEHRHFYDIVDYLRAGDVLVLNNSKVFPARLIGTRKTTGGRLEIFLLRRIKFPSRGGVPRRGGEGDRDSGIENNFIDSKDSSSSFRKGTSRWECLVGGKRARVGLVAEFGKGLECELVKDNQDGTWEADFNMADGEMMKLVEIIGEMPLPPYIKQKTGDRKQREDDKGAYQTVYAKDDKAGSVAAPTAGFHFTPELLKKIKDKGVEIEYITLHVGLGTFLPVKTEDISKHKMHAEYVEVGSKTMANIYMAKHEGRQIISVGTTSARTLEAMILKFPISNFQYRIGSVVPTGLYGFPNNSQLSNFQKQFSGFSQFVNIFIYPGYEFKIVDGLLTNFHLPKSTLLMMVSALAGKENIDKAYREAIKEKYRFFSYGDAMFIR
jgi:S-adenosylmethionine:tRNA ribosyltransferase-isomerase